MIMENLIFVGLVCALGIIIYSLKQHTASRTVKNHKLADNHHPVPPRKRTISGQDPLEEAQVEFQQRIENWQKAQMPRWSTLKNSADRLAGERYIPSPLPKKSLNGSIRQAAEKRVRQQFELLN
jgi:hypothetical protein